MSLPTPPRYVVLPEDVIEQAYAPDKPRRALLASFTRILSLAWEAKYQHTPPLDEWELIAFLKLSRRQFYEQKADMELLGWLRSSHPRPGFVQFSFSRSGADTVVLPASAENRTASAENPLIGGGESLESNLNSDSLSPPVDASAENRTFPNVVEILRHTDKLFDGALVVSKDLENREPLYALAWCAYAYSNKRRLTGAGGVVRNRLKDNDPPPEWAKQQWQEVLPDDFLEALGLIVYVCPDCGAPFKKVADRDTHSATHPKRFACPHCEQAFGEEIDLDSHIDQEHLPKTIPVDESVRRPVRAGSPMTPEQAWQSVLGQLAMEMPRAAFDTWVRDTHAVRYDGNALSIGVRNAYAREWLESRLASTVERLLVGILNASVDVAFVVSNFDEGDV